MPRLDQLLGFEYSTAYKSLALREMLAGSTLDKAFFLYQNAL